MTRTLAFSSPLLLGFEDIERLLDRVSKTADGYPPYNIERIAADGDDPARIKITLAVAGFDPNDIEVTVEENELTVSGRQAEDERAATFCIAGSPRGSSGGRSCLPTASR